MASLSLQQTNIQRVQELLAHYQQGNAGGYLEGVSPDVKGSMLGGLFDGADNIVGKDAFIKVLEQVPDKMEVSKFEAYNWRAVNDEVWFTVDWEFVWKPTGKKVETTAIVRKVLCDGLITEKYHMVDVESITGQPSPHDQSAVVRVKELLGEYMNGNAGGYLEGVAPDIKGSVLGGLIEKADTIDSKEAFMAVMGKMPDVMTVEKFHPYNYHALPNSDMMFTVDWKFLWKPTGKTVETTAIVRKVVRDGKICEKWHLVDSAAILQESPREVICDTDPAAAVTAA